MRVSIAGIMVFMTKFTSPKSYDQQPERCCSVARALARLNLRVGVWSFASQQHVSGLLRLGNRANGFIQSVCGVSWIGSLTDRFCVTVAFLLRSHWPRSIRISPEPTRYAVSNDAIY